MTDDVDQLLRDHLTKARRSYDDAVSQAADVQKGSLEAEVLAVALKHVGDLIAGLERLARERAAMRRRQELHILRQTD